MSPVTRGLGGIRDAVRRQLGTDTPGTVDVDPAVLPRFGAGIQDLLPPEKAAEFREQAEELQPWLQGPFYLGGDVLIGGQWRTDQRWGAMRGHVVDVSGKSVIDVGCNAGYDSFMFKSLGATDVVGCEPYEFIQQARFLESIYQSGVRFEQLGWQDLDPEQLGTFDVVHCGGVLYHEPHPILMLERLRSMVAPGGTLLLGTMILPDPAHDDYTRFVPSAYYEDDTWWWVFGRRALRGMIETVGFTYEKTPVDSDSGPPGEFPVGYAYIQATAAEPKITPHS